MQIIVASDNKSIRDAIGMLVRVQPDLELVGVVEDIAELLVKIKDTGAPRVVLDWDALGQRVDTLLDLLQLFEEPPSLVALSVREEARADVHSAGIASFAHKGEPPDRLLAAIRGPQRLRPAKSQQEPLLQEKIDAQEADKLEWLPLGVFALCKSQAGDPTMFLQLAITREGIVAGSFANTTNNENLSVQGGADRESTRLAITIGDQDDVVVETGLYNVTEQQSSAVVHYQDGTRENWLLVKMPDPQGEQDQQGN